MLAAAPGNGLVCGDKRNPLHAASVRILDEMIEEREGKCFKPSVLAAPEARLSPQAA